MTPSNVKTRHHYVPQFYLREWCTNGTLICHYLSPRGTVVSKRKATTAVAWEKDLYTLQHAVPYMKPDPPDAIENWFGRLEERAARVHQKMLTSKGDAELTAEERTTWVHFLRSFAVRSPHRLRPIDTIDAPALAAALRADLEAKEEQATYPREPLTTLLSEMNAVAMAQNVARETIVRFVKEPAGVQRVLDHQWFHVTCGPDSNFEFLTSDRPVYSLAKDGQYMILLMALSPYHLFMATPMKEPFTEDLVKGLIVICNLLLLSNGPSQVYSRRELVDGNIRMKYAVTQTLLRQTRST